MLSIAKINSAYNQVKHSATSKGGYLFYLQSSSTRQRTDFLDYLSPDHSVSEPEAFWAGRGTDDFALSNTVELDQVEKLAWGYSPSDGKPLVRGAGAAHVMGIDMTFSAPKDVSAVFAAAHPATQSAINDCMQKAVHSALDYTESISVTRHGAAGRIKKKVSAIIAACYPHFASRAIQPQLHVHAFLFNLGKRAGSKEWSALDNKAQFDHKMVTGMLFRVDLAYQLARLGFQIMPDGQYFQIKGVSEHQRQTLSKRRAEIQAFMAAHDGKTALDADIAALNTRSAKAEPPYLELLGQFRDMTAELGLTAEYVASLQTPLARQAPQEFSISPQALLDELTQTQSTVKVQDVLHLICKKSMGIWNAQQCRDALARFLQHEEVLHLGNTEHLTHVITSRALHAKEHAIAARVERGRHAATFTVQPATVTRFFDGLREDLSRSTGHAVSLDEQEAAAQYICGPSGHHAFVVGSAGTGKTTLLKAVAGIYRSEGYELVGCAQAASAALNLTREAGISSSTIASLLLRHQKGTQSFSAKTILVLDEAGMVGSREFDLLQTAVIEGGGKMICVGDYKQQGAIEAGGIFRSLVETFNGASITKIQRQRTDFTPLYQALGDSSAQRKPLILKEQLAAIQSLSMVEQSAALDALADGSALLASVIRPWQARSDFLWMREVVDQLSQGHAEAALTQMAVKGQLHMQPDRQQAMDSLIHAWKRDDRPLTEKVIIAGSRQEVATLNQHARRHLLEIGHLDERQSRIRPLVQRDGVLDHREFCPNERLVITKNHPTLGLVNGATGTLRAFQGQDFLSVELDEPNTKGEKWVLIPASFHHLDHAYSLTTFKSQGRTFDAAYVFVNPSMAHREWAYVAASRTRYRTALYVPVDELDQAQAEELPHQNEQLDDALTPMQKLSRCMARSRVKSTTIDYEESPSTNVHEPIPPPAVSVHRIIQQARSLRTRCQQVAKHWVQRIKEKAFEQELHR